MLILFVLYDPSKVFINNSEVRWIINGPRPTHPTLTIRAEETAHEVVVNYYEPTQPNPSCDEVDAVRLVS